MWKIKDLTKQKFGKLIAIEIIGKSKSRSSIWKCKCECGNFHEVMADYLINGEVKSCGCIRKEKNHNLCNTKFYKKWSSMKNRCFDIENNRYGGRGITVCERWLDFKNFKDDMYESYLKHIEEFGNKETSIDRINNDGNYEPTNCRWATIKEQRINRSSSKFFEAISPSGLIFVSNNRKDFADKHNLHNSLISLCLNNKIKQHKGWKFNFKENE